MEVILVENTYIKKSTNQQYIAVSSISAITITIEMPELNGFEKIQLAI